MKATGSIFDEPPVFNDGTGETHVTNEVCEAVDKNSYLIEGQSITFPVMVADAGMLMNAFLVDARAAQAMIAESGFRVVEHLSMRAN